jgi:mono/diheme cytochrome c family protein
VSQVGSWAEVLSTVLLLLTVVAAACAPSGGSAVEGQLARGQPIYAQGCATEKCHGVNGEGIPRGSGFQVWPLVGADFQRRNPTAQAIFDVVRSGGEPSLRALSDQQIYDAIAYELSLNEVAASVPVVAGNAALLPTGAAAGSVQGGQLFPPPGNAKLILSRASLALPLDAEDTESRMRLTQVAQTAAIGQSTPPAGAVYLLMVITLEDLTDGPLEVGPEHLELVGTDGEDYAPLDIGLAYPVDRFRTQTIEPEHGTAGLAVFAVPDSQSLGHLLYTLPSGRGLVLELAK